MKSGIVRISGLLERLVRQTGLLVELDEAVLAVDADTGELGGCLISATSARSRLNRAGIGGDSGVVPGSCGTGRSDSQGSHDQHQMPQESLIDADLKFVQAEQLSPASKLSFTDRFGFAAAIRRGSVTGWPSGAKH
ncbi:hypothetical protein ACIBQX_41085 [Nonomuraea sp. NPDC049714]|uniref:hypothetical protein n=1 Tax=Nonomuraea sp. NPDC049714 TaxID=3364357 RepID=UPI00379D8E33